MNLVRKYKISKLLNKLDTTDVENKCIEFVKNTVYNLEESYHENVIVYSLPNKYVFSYNSKTKILMVNHNFLFRHNLIKIHTTLVDFEGAWDLILYVLTERFKIKIKKYHTVIDGNNLNEYL